MPEHSAKPEAGRPRLYGRAKGRPLRGHQQALMQDLYPQIEIDVDKVHKHILEKELWLEIGFGGGEHLIWQAEKNPDVALWGAEPFINGVAKVVAAVDQKNLENMRLYRGDGRLVLDCLQNESVSRLFVLFPDPWPKARHNKRRLITERFLDDAYRILKPGAHFRFASDITDYVDWTLTRVLQHGGFSWRPETQSSWRTRPSDWPQTRYESKANREGRPSHYFEFERQ